MTRPDRVAELIKEEVSRIIHEDVSDPRIGFISITQVDISADLENAKIMVSILGSEDKKQECMDGLYSATSFIRGKLGGLLGLRVVPEIRFIRDDSLEKGSRVLGIINQLEKEDERKILRHKKSAKKR
ncbi:MAG: 30S ribosome-binding factor RbfA [Candidatus Margulisbacteria bacterium]|nr:30S ribosome-binding factor RbfA [Candidatus Margulisiibacteriota bacterium]